jgi:hypothetical protein
MAHAMPLRERHPPPVLRRPRRQRPAPATPAGILALQPLAGNAAVSGLLQRAPVAQARDVRFPEDYPTYEGWLAAIDKAFGLATKKTSKSFTSRDTATEEWVKKQPKWTPKKKGDVDPNPYRLQGTQDEVLGGAAARPGEEAEPVGPSGIDHFVDHPTDAWVREHLPERLRETAYQLPTDCADILVVLRHVWLASHGRTERAGSWTIGAVAGGETKEQENVKGVIGEVYTENVSQLLNPYTDGSGKPIRSFELLKTMLHPGDGLVWEHHDEPKHVKRTGGHSQTIAHVDRDDAGNAKGLVLLHGNEPIGKPQFKDVQDEWKETRKDAVPGEMDLRHHAGRRIDIGRQETLHQDDRFGMDEGGDMRDVLDPSSKAKEPVWTWLDGHTRLVAAGPSAAAQRPATPPPKKGETAQRSITDWLGPIKKAKSGDELLAVVEAAFAEARGMIEGGTAPVSHADCEAIGTAAGETLTVLSRTRGSLGLKSPAQVRDELRSMIRELGAAGRVPEVKEAFGHASNELGLATIDLEDTHTADVSSKGGGRLADHVASLDTASADNLAPRLEEAVHDIGLLVDGDELVSDDEAKAVGRAAVKALGRVGKKADVRAKLLAGLLGVADASKVPAKAGALVGLVRAELEAAPE